MNLVKFCKVAPLAAATTIGAFAFSAPALAQEDGITVLSPYSIKRERERGSITGAEQVSVSTRVSYRDLNLRRPADVNELYRRVDFAARDVCRQADLLIRASYALDDARTCYTDAMRGAKRQANRAIAYANRW